jgi:hypothetical protein
VDGRSGYNACQWHFLGVAEADPWEGKRQRQLRYGGVAESVSSFGIQILSSIRQDLWFLVFGYGFWFWRSGSLSRSGQIAQGTEISPLGGSREDEAELFQNQRKQVCCGLPAIDDQEKSISQYKNKRG